VSHSPTRQVSWSLVHEERAALADDLAGLDGNQWRRPTLCGDWVVEDVVAHLTAGASVGTVRWLASILAARFDPDLHNQRRLAEHRGRTPSETLDRFRQAVTSTTAPTGHTAAWLGEVVVHGQDIRRVLGLERTPPVGAVTEVARFYAQRDFTVAGHSAIAGLRLEATDGPFRAGDGLLVSGTTLALTMAMAGRRVYCADLTGPGMPTLERRCPSA
jgi:uncharacterized protein (TIGR03083 family)